MTTPSYTGTSARQKGRRFLGVDCGTQGTKALLVDDEGNALGRGYAKHVLIEESSGAREQEPKWWIEALGASVRQAMDSVPRETFVSAMGVSGQQHGLVVLDENLEVIRPAKLWNDTETAPQNKELVRRLGGPHEIFERFGIVPRTGYTVSKLLWLAEREPQNFARIRHILLPHEYLNFYLTGRLRSEFGDASGTAYFDVRSRTWSREVLDAIDGGRGQLFAALPEFIAADGIVGKLRHDVAAELGLPEECLVSSGGGDNMMGAIGTGNVQEGIVTLSLGTSATVYSYSDRPSNDFTGNVAPFCSSSGGWLPLVCTMNATNVVMRTVELLGRTVSDIDSALNRTPIGADELVFLPFLNGERTPDLPGACGSIHGISAINFTPDHIIRAAIEGVSFGILNGLDLILQNEPAQAIRLIGGGARSNAWRQLLADASGAEIHVPAKEEAGCLGAAIQAMVAYSVFSDQAVSFKDVSESVVRLDESATCTPRSEYRAAYDKARLCYREQLDRQYPTLRQDRSAS
jgi:xylulokinase